MQVGERSFCGEVGLVLFCGGGDERGMRFRCFCADHSPVLKRSLYHDGESICFLRLLHGTQC